MQGCDGEQMKMSALRRRMCSLPTPEANESGSGNEKAMCYKCVR